jgi:hypothetical protein
MHECMLIGVKLYFKVHMGFSVKGKQVTIYSIMMPAFGFQINNFKMLDP